MSGAWSFIWPILVTGGFAVGAGWFIWWWYGDDDDY